MLAAAALIVAMVLGSRDEPATESDPRMARDAPRSRPPLDRQIGQLLMLSFEGTEVPDYVRDSLRAGHASGAALFARNVASEDQVRALTRDLQDAARGRALIATDQEGGEARTLPFAAPTASASPG
jgi:beta-N-acetylhexosaminidase